MGINTITKISPRLAFGPPCHRKDVLEVILIALL